nr:GEVED domain-containing protein [Flavobacterium sp. SM15]
MSSITRTGLTPGSVIYVRFWEYSNDNPGTFGICASSPAPCTVPTAQPTALVLTPSGGNVSGTFTAASPIPTNYLVVYSTSNTPPVPTNGTSYTVGGTVAPGYIVGDIDTDTAFTVTGLSSNTTYYFYIFSFNQIGCSGGPTYLTTSPLTNNITTGLAYCTPSATGTDYITGFSTANGVNNITYTSGTRNPNGYGDFYTSRTVSQIQGGTINFTETYVSSFSHGFRIWVDWNNDGDFVDGGEQVFASAAIATGHTGSFAVPGGASIGDHRMRIRAYYNNNTVDPCATGYVDSEALDFKLTVLTPLACAGNPSNLTASAITGNSATASWTAAAPVPGLGYQYYLTTSSTAPVAGTTPTGSLAGTSVNLTSLTAETTYYFWVRSNCTVANQGYWIGPLIIRTLCQAGTGTGTSALACPTVISGGLGLNGAPPPAITCSSASSCVDLEATYLALGQTTSYAATSIPYAPPYNFGCMANPVSVNVDDVWSPTINLPFNFCFYGTNYNKCLIGSNGVITFDTTSNTPGGSSAWSFSSNLPSTSLFKNTIFGVYQDIDPGKGGTIGWELITLNSGCRALVASWKDIPMFSTSCNSMLYTGMMVLYENTNIIEVYISEKNICASWNGGNGLVGVQDSTGTVATTAPGRNSLDPDWTVTNEAWRFTPNGTSVTSIKWYEGAAIPPITPSIATTNNINVCPAATTTYTAEVTYSLCNGRTIKEYGQTTVTVAGNKTWNGSVDTDWNKANNWTPSGIPTALDCVVIPSTTNKPLISGTNYNGLGRNLIVQNGGILTINPTNNISVTDAITINAGGDIIVESGASIMQTNNVANTGTAHIKRNTQPMYRFDYSYWNSPVTQASNFTLGTLSPNTLSDKYWSYNPQVWTFNGHWQAETTATVMTPLKGYAVRAPQTFSTNPATRSVFTGTFIGTPNNGNFSIPLYISTNATAIAANEQRLNLIGNPYPSAISTDDFIKHNSVDNPNIDGTIYIWTHATPISNATPSPWYQNYVYNYSASDYINKNRLGYTGTLPTGIAPAVVTDYIASGQSFFVRARVGATAAALNNTMRKLNNNGYFFRESDDTAGPAEKNRLWLNISNLNGGGFNQTLVGYTSEGTLDWDYGLDGETLSSLTTSIYSLGADKKLSIQARPTFDINDQVPMGYKVPASGTYFIAIDRFDDYFQNQNVYLEDKQTNVIHNLKATPYSFNSEAGSFDDRFVLRYTETTLGNQDISELENSVVIFTNDKLNVKSTLEPIKEVIVYDVLGRVLLNSKEINKSDFTATTLSQTKSTLVIKVTLENNAVITKKVIY